MPDLSKYKWGLPTVEVAQPYQLSELKSDLASPQGVDHVCLALQVLITLHFLGVFDKTIHGIAMKVITQNPGLLSQAFYKIYFELINSNTTQQKQDFIAQLTEISRSFKKDDFYLIKLEDFKKSIMSFNAISLDLKNYLPFSYEFNPVSGHLVVNTDYESIKTYTFHIEYNSNKNNPLIPQKIYINSDNNEHVNKFITLKVLAYILKEEYQENYFNLIHLSLDDFCNPKEKHKDYQLAYTTILIYFKIKKVLVQIDKLLSQMPTLTDQIHQLLNEYGCEKKFKDFTSDGLKNLLDKIQQIPHLFPQFFRIKELINENDKFIEENHIPSNHALKIFNEHLKKYSLNFETFTKNAKSELQDISTQIDKWHLSAKKMHITFEDIKNIVIQALQTYKNKLTALQNSGLSNQVFWDSRLQLTNELSTQLIPLLAQVWLFNDKLSLVDSIVFTITNKHDLQNHDLNPFSYAFLQALSNAIWELNDNLTAYALQKQIYTSIAKAVIGKNNSYYKVVEPQGQEAVCIIFQYLIITPKPQMKFPAAIKLIDVNKIFLDAALEKLYLALPFEEQKQLFVDKLKIIANYFNLNREIYEKLMIFPKQTYSTANALSTCHIYKAFSPTASSKESGSYSLRNSPDDNLIFSPIKSNPDNNTSFFANQPF